MTERALGQQEEAQITKEGESEVVIMPVADLNLEHLAIKTKGEYVNGKVLWSLKEGVVNGRLSREQRGSTSHNETIKTVFYMTTETYKDEVTDYMAVINKNKKEVALIDGTNPLTNTVLGFLIKSESVERIMGNDSKFEDDNPEYIIARNMAYQRELDILKTQIH